MYLAGVLQRIAVAYFFAALMFCFLGTRALVCVCLTLLIGYWALMTQTPVPGFGPPNLDEPGKNLAHYLDQRYLPGRKFEGTLLSTMAAVANCLMGILAGLLLKNDRVPAQRKVGMARGNWRAEPACRLRLERRNFPIIKLLWTSSYVLVSCGYAALLLAVFYQVIEIWKRRAWSQPFVWIGMNALPVYIIAGVVNFHRLAERLVGGDVKVFLGRFGGLASSMTAVALALWLANFLYRKRIFLRL